MSDYRDYTDFYDGIVRLTLKNLERNGFTALFVPDREQALQEVLTAVPEGATVGVGGSLTVRQLDLISHLKRRGHTVFDHWEKGLTKEQVNQVRRSQQTSDVFLSSTNVITTDGKLVNIDGVGNRVAAMTHGPKKVVIVAGYNKIVQDVQKGLDKIKNEITPKNALRLGLDVPCIKAGHCVDCSSPSRLCRVTSIIEKRPMQTKEFVVIIIGEEYGL